MPLLSFLTLITVIQYIVVCVRFFDVDGHVHLMDECVLLFFFSFTVVLL